MILVDSIMHILGRIGSKKRGVVGVGSVLCGENAGV